ncbi:vacuolar proton ATPase a1-like [Hibiscus syriacus]|uniref:Vacuolar proton ATPase a1-like n=1 Tax=Hibiscus syriacus TaxID=106335 RepID=A0A6A3BYM2_HIBSY|nr:vacuolar proton ATPase a1-like [Hibiscus syriacus]
MMGITMAMLLLPQNGYSAVSSCWSVAYVGPYGLYFSYCLGKRSSPVEAGMEFQGIFVTGVAYYLQAWVISKKGPVFHAVMTPSNLVTTILGSVFLLGETINLGSVVGETMLVIRLYSVLWGKSKEHNIENVSCLPVQDQTQVNRS